MKIFADRFSIDGRVQLNMRSFESVLYIYEYAVYK